MYGKTNILKNFIKNIAAPLLVGGAAVRAYSAYKKEPIRMGNVELFSNNAEEKNIMKIRMKDRDIKILNKKTTGEKSVIEYNGQSENSNIEMSRKFLISDKEHMSLADITLRDPEAEMTFSIMGKNRKPIGEKTPSEYTLLFPIAEESFLNLTSKANPSNSKASHYESLYQNNSGKEGIYYFNVKTLGKSAYANFNLTPKKSSINLWNANNKHILEARVPGLLRSAWNIYENTQNIKDKTYHPLAQIINKNGEEIMSYPYTQDEWSLSKIRCKLGVIPMIAKMMLPTWRICKDTSRLLSGISPKKQK